MPSESSPGKGLRVGGIISAVVGVAVVGTGVGLALKANGLSTTDYSQSREDQRSSLKTWSMVSYGVGAAAIVTGVVLYIVGWPSEQSSSVALLPGRGPGQGVCVVEREILDASLFNDCREGSLLPVSSRARRLRLQWRQTAGRECTLQDQ
jgi:hypothetical protein